MLIEELMKVQVLIVNDTSIGLAEINFSEFHLAGRVWMANGKWWCWGLQQWGPKGARGREGVPSGGPGPKQRKPGQRGRLSIRCSPKKKASCLDQRGSRENGEREAT